MINLGKPWEIHKQTRLLILFQFISKDPQEIMEYINNIPDEYVEQILQDLEILESQKIMNKLTE
jgi:hypothetical protein